MALGTRFVVPTAAWLNRKRPRDDTRNRKHQMQLKNETPKPTSGLRAHVQDRAPAFLSTLIGGAVAMAVNAPLTSPDDLIGNAGSVAVGSLIAAIVLGMLWSRLSGEVQQRARLFNIVLTGFILLVVVAAVIIEYLGEVSNAIRYIIPLAAIVTILASVLTPLFERWKSWQGFIWLAIALPIAILAIGYWLTVNEFGFTEPPTLTLPPPPA